MDKNGTRKRAKRPQIGEVFGINLPNGKTAYAQYVSWSDELGFLMRVWDLLRDGPILSFQELHNRGFLFPPVFVGLLGTLRLGRWRRMGMLPVLNFTFPKFRYTHGTKPGTYHDWLIWDGKTTTPIGDLPVDLRSLELKSVWGDEGLEERIVTGVCRGDWMW